MKRKKIVLISLITLILVILAISIFLIFNRKFTIKLMVDNNLYKEIEVRYGNTIEEVPTKEGYTFVGWYVDNKKYDNKTKVKENLTLTAKWEVAKYTITFDDDNGGITKEEVLHNELVSKPIDPTKKGYAFLGWYLDDKKFDFKTPITKNLTLKAKWSETINKQSVDISSLIKTYLNSSNDFNSTINKEKISVDIINANNNLSDLLKIVKENTDNILKREEIKSIEVTFGKVKYTINNVKDLDKLFTSLTDTSLLDYNERHLSSLYNKTLTVKFNLDNDNYYAKNGVNKYTINFTSKNVVTTKELDNLSLKAVKYIKIYDVSFNTYNHNIVAKYDFKYANQKIFNLLYDASGLGGGKGTGLNDAVQTLGTNTNISKLNIHLKNNNVKSITREQMKTAMSSSFKMMGFGDDIIKAMGINGTVTSVYHYQFQGKSVDFSLELVSGKAFEDGFNNHYKLTIVSNV